VIVISRFRRVIEFAAARLRQFRPYVIVGATPSRERAEIRRRFCSPMGEGRVLLGTEAIERGLNLQAAGVLYNLDLPWNAARLRQRVGRIARVGQSRRKALVLNSIAKLGKARSVDDWILTIVLGKRRLFAEVFGSDDVDEVGREAVDLSAARAFLSGSRV
jgi:superfamily II DNA/RNA helicase